VTTAKGIAFLDIEASGLGPSSFPLEVGWAFLDGPSGSRLIKPASGWNYPDRDPLADELHGITWQQIDTEGLAAWEVAAALEQLLGGGRSTVFSDAPQMGGFWLDRLFEQFSAERSFQLVDFTLALRRTFPLTPAADDADRGVLRHHRAEADALLLRQLWLSARRD